MSAHLWLRPDTKVYYIVAGRHRESTGTTKRKYAEFKLEQYIRGEYAPHNAVIVRLFFREWITELQGQRKSYIRDKWQHFERYIFPEDGDRRLCDIDYAHLQKLIGKLLKITSAKTGKPLTVKTVKNIVDGSYRAMFREARRRKLVQGDPFKDLQWPDEEDAPAPWPFEVMEMSLILAGFKKLDPFYFPLVLHQFETGMRPGETAAMKINCVKNMSVSILKSRHLKEDNNPKTKRSRRTIDISQSLEALYGAIRLPWQDGEDYLFYNKFGGVLDINEWSKDYWPKMLERLGVPYRKFYSTRHTAITEAIKAGWELMEVKQRFGTSIEMLEKNYCGKLNLHSPKLARDAEFSTGYMASPTGFENVGSLSSKLQDVVTTEIFKNRRDRRAG